MPGLRSLDFALVLKRIALPFFFVTQGCRPNEKERWNLIAEAVPGKSAAQCQKHFLVLKEQLKGQKGEAGANGASNGHAEAPAAEGGAGADGAAAEAPGAGGEDWTEEQEAALAKALKAHPKGNAASEKERWVAVAALVPGKNAPQCKLVRRKAQRTYPNNQQQCLSSSASAAAPDQRCQLWRRGPCLLTLSESFCEECGAHAKRSSPLRPSLLAPAALRREGGEARRKEVRGSPCSVASQRAA